METKTMNKAQMRTFNIEVTLPMAPDATLVDALREARATLHSAGHTLAVVTPVNALNRKPLENAIAVIGVLRAYTQSLSPRDHKRMVEDLSNRGLDMQRAMQDIGEILNEGRNESIAKVIADITIPAGA